MSYSNGSPGANYSMDLFAKGRCGFGKSLLNATGWSSSTSLSSNCTVWFQICLSHNFIECHEVLNQCTVLGTVAEQHVNVRIFYSLTVSKWQPFCASFLQLRSLSEVYCSHSYQLVDNSVNPHGTKEYQYTNFVRLYSYSKFVITELKFGRMRTNQREQQLFLG